MDAIRNGSFTSSKIAALTTNGKAKDSFGASFYTYIEEKNMERRLNRSLEKDMTSRPTSWGNCVEEIPFELLSIKYTLQSHETLSHPTIPCWKGSPDVIKFDPGTTVGDLKCPETLKSFCQLVDPLYSGLTGMDLINKIRDTHPQGEKYYWQLLSNAILTKAKYAELIVFCPYKSQLERIKELANLSGNPKYYWIWTASDEELPYLVEGGHYKNLNVIRFEVPLADKLLLHKRVEEAQKLLIKPVKLLTAV